MAKRKDELTLTSVDHSPARCSSQHYINECEPRMSVSQRTEREELVRRKGRRDWQDVNQTNLAKCNFPVERRDIQYETTPRRV
jgi:hypothetical protein